MENVNKDLKTCQATEDKVKGVEEQTEFWKIKADRLQQRVSDLEEAVQKVETGLDDFNEAPGTQWEFLMDPLDELFALIRRNS